MESIKYIVHYDTPDSSEKRNTSPATVTKVDYILKVLDRLGVKTEVVSASGSACEEKYPESTTKIGQNIVLKKFKTLCRGNKILNVISRVLFNARFYSYLLKNVKDNDVVVAYHSLALIKVLKTLKKKRNIRLLLEVEEIYGDVIGDPNASKRELEFFKLADAYIFPTEKLNEKVNTQSKPTVIIYGTYETASDAVEKFNDGRIHCVYAGTLDPRKGGVCAIGAGGYLNKDYVIHILGFGTQQQIENIEKAVERENEKCGAEIIFEGLLQGKEYTNFLQKCHIGLSPQDPMAQFNATSFPSKILSYLSNGLRVVSIRIPSIESSAVASQLYFYDLQTEQEIANAISSVDINEKKDGRAIVRELDKQFGFDLKNLLEFL